MCGRTNRSWDQRCLAVAHFGWFATRRSDRGEGGKMSQVVPKTVPGSASLWRGEPTVPRVGEWHRRQCCGVAPAPLLSQSSRSYRGRPRSKLRAPTSSCGSPTEPSSRWSCRQPWWASQSPWRRPRPFLKLDFGSLRAVVFECSLVLGKISDMLIMDAHKMDDNVATFSLGEFALCTKLFHKHRGWSPSGDREDETALSRAHVSGSHVNISAERKRSRGTGRICLLLDWTLLNCETLMIGQNDANTITWQ